jgi:hypothetical protein
MRRLGLATALAAIATAGGAAAAGDGTDRSRASARGPFVEAMVAGRTQVLLPARRVRAGGALIAVGKRRCVVAWGTPLAVLAALRRRGGPAFRTRDYGGSCSRDPRDAAGLFVFEVGGERNRGPSGWVYKVGRRVGIAGAGDPDGPFGRGRLRSGQRVLWFWCRQSRRRCQRTLALRLRTRRARPGGRLTVGVRGYDDRGRGVAARGAIVRLDAAVARAGANGRVTLRAPRRAGSYRLWATRRGMVAAFPEEVTVR